MASCEKKESLGIYLNTLIGLPGGFGAWLCPLLAKVELINSVNHGLESHMWRPGEP